MIEENAAERRVFSVREFSAELDRLFQKRPGLANIAIRGEISGLSEFGNGHVGFKLKEQEAILECVVWNDRRRALPELENGAAVIAVGSIRVRPERGGYQLRVDSVELVGIGALFLEYQRMRALFESEGLFEQSRKRTVPPLPLRVAVISARGHGLEDFVETLRRQIPFVNVAVVETRVQGVGAEIDVAEALDAASKQTVDVIVLTRGGGSYEDLFTFNREPVVRAIVRAKRPVITAIGHTRNTHLADEAADLSFGTPSLAAEFISKRWLEAQRHLTQSQRDLARSMRDALLRGEQRTDRLGRDLGHAAARIVAGKTSRFAQHLARLESRNPQRFLADVRSRITASAGKLDTVWARYASRKAHEFGEARARLERASVAFSAQAARRLERAEAGLGRVDPLSPLTRGYAIVTANGKALRDARDVREGDAVEARLERGILGARVESVRNDE